jgi:hypothetical protein
MIRLLLHVLYSHVGWPRPFAWKSRAQTAAQWEQTAALPCSISKKKGTRSLPGARDHGLGADGSGVSVVHTRPAIACSSAGSRRASSSSHRAPWRLQCSLKLDCHYPRSSSCDLLHGTHRPRAASVQNPATSGCAGAYPLIQKAFPACIKVRIW